MNKKGIVSLILVIVLLFAFAINVCALPLCPHCGGGCVKEITCLQNGYDEEKIYCPECGYVWSTKLVPCTHILPRD